MTTMATTAATTAAIAGVTGRQEEDNDADSPSARNDLRHHPSCDPRHVALNIKRVHRIGRSLAEFEFTDQATRLDN